MHDTFTNHWLLSTIIQTYRLQLRMSSLELTLMGYSWARRKAESSSRLISLRASEQLIVTNTTIHTARTKVTHFCVTHTPLLGSCPPPTSQVVIVKSTKRFNSKKKKKRTERGHKPLHIYTRLARRNYEVLTIISQLCTLLVDETNG